MDYQERVNIEKEELDTKRDKLAAFKATPTWQNLEGEERDLLNRQLKAMNTYSDILGKRIKRFKN